MKKILKSVNIEDDIWHTERISHYVPTSRSKVVVSAVMRPSANVVVAAYGSGKSLAASLGAISVQNLSVNKKFLSDMSNQIKVVDEGLAIEIQQRVSSKNQGKVILLNGFVPDLQTAICESLAISNEKSFQAVLGAVNELSDVDHVAIVWDEFGRHLSGLVMEGRSRDLDFVQKIAEWSVRAKNPSVSFTLLLHQNLQAYAENLNRAAQNEWRKIEGRFEYINFVEDSKELYELLADVIAERSNKKPSSRDLIAQSKIICELGWFDNINSRDVVKDLIAKAWPLSAGALQVLPKLASRVGQNERSLFSFIESVDLQQSVGMNEVYDAFSASIRADVGVGGLHRKWVEVESARHKCESDLENEIIAAAFLLQIGQSGERKQLTRKTLELAVRSKGYSQTEVKVGIEDLILRKLLLHRKLNDDISVWHGADIDVSAKVDEERKKLKHEFNLQEFLELNCPAPFVKPIRHNIENGTSRYLRGNYILPDQIKNIGKIEPKNAPWGTVSFVICDSADDITVAENLVAKESGREQTYVLPKSPIDVRDVSLEIEALLNLKKDQELLASDPLIESELNELLDVARQSLDISIHRLTSQRPTSTIWYNNGKRLDVDRFQPASIAVSEIMDKVYPKTPKINNIQLVRQMISQPMNTNRIRLITKLLEFAEKPNLDYSDDDGSAAASIYRTVLRRTGLHKVSTEGKGSFANPNDINSDRGLKQVWQHLQEFFTKPGEKPLESIVTLLGSSPFGLAAGVIPVVIMASYKAFGSCVSMYRNNEYVPDILGFDAVRMFENQTEFKFKVVGNDESTLNYLSDLSFVFAQQRPGKYDEHVRFAYSSLMSWYDSVGDGAKRSKHLTILDHKLLREIYEMEDPTEFFLETLPQIFTNKNLKSKKNLNKVTKSESNRVIKAVEDCRKNIDGLIDGYIRDAIKVIKGSLSLNSLGNSSKPSKNSLAGIREWISCFNIPEMMKRSDLKYTDKRILEIAKETSNNQHTPETLARMLSSMLLQRSMEKWQDETADHLRKELRECRHRIESTALDIEKPSKQLQPVVKARIEFLENLLKKMT